MSVGWVEAAGPSALRMPKAPERPKHQRRPVSRNVTDYAVRVATDSVDVKVAEHCLVLRKGASLQGGGMAKPVSAERPQYVAFFRHKRSGKVLWARDYGLKGWPLPRNRRKKK